MKYRRSAPEKPKGRHEWQVMFNYLIEATGEPKGDVQFAWHKPEKSAAHQTRHVGARSGESGASEVEEQMR
jgi:hypothetical protein